MWGEGSELGERSWFYVAAVLANAAQQHFPRGAEGTALPAGVLIPWIAFLSLQDPLQRVVHDSPSFIELGYETI